MRAFVSITAVLALGLGGALAGRASAKPVTAQDIAQFEVGAATSDQVIHKLGKPYSVATSSDGTTVVTYSSTHLSPKAASFVPIVGMFAGGTSGASSLVTFNFGADGLLKSATTTTTNIDCTVHVVAVSCEH